MTKSAGTQSPSAYTPTEAARLLAASTSALQGVVQALPPSLVVWQPAPGEWSALEVIGHLVETDERGFGGRIRTILAEERPQFTGWDPDTVSRDRRDNERNPAALLAEFSQPRLAHIALVETLTETDLDRGGDHPDVGWLTARPPPRVGPPRRQPPAPDPGQRPGLHLAAHGKRATVFGVTKLSAIG